MEIVAAVAALALIEYYILLMLCGQARGRFDVAAPATAGNPAFERYFRVQMNTLEQLIVFLPALLLFALYVSPSVAAGLGLVFIVGRALYARAYVTDPARRGPGFLLSMIPNLILLIGGLVGATVQFFS